MSAGTNERLGPAPGGALDELARDDFARKRFLKVAGKTMGAAGAASALGVFLAACGGKSKNTAATASQATTPPKPARSQSDVAGLLDQAVAASSVVPVIDVGFAFGSDRLSFFSVVSTIGTPIDITAQELRVEAFFPSDDATHQAWTRDTP